MSKWLHVTMNCLSGSEVPVTQMWLCKSAFMMVSVLVSPAISFGVFEPIKLERVAFSMNYYYVYI